MGFLKQGHWSGLPFTSPGYLLGPTLEPGSPALQVGSLPSEPPGVYFPNFPYKKIQVKLLRLKHMIWYETQQSQCSWGPWLQEGDRVKPLSKIAGLWVCVWVCVCVCVCVCSVCSVYVLSFWAWNRLKYILTKSRGVMRILERKDFIWASVEIWTLAFRTSVTWAEAKQGREQGYLLDVSG